MTDAAIRLACVAGVALVAFVVGWGVAYGSAVKSIQESGEAEEQLPLPHHVPKTECGLVFRFAMAHDVLHERYPRSGPAYHRERVRVTRAELAKYDPDAPLALSLTDDLAAAHARLGEHDEAVALMRAKLARQKKLGQEGPALYTTLSNLGTSLTYGAWHKAAAGDWEALARLREGTERLRDALIANPMAHFGREKWQAAVAEHLLAAVANPGRLSESDCLGCSFLRPDTEALGAPGPYGSAADPRFHWRLDNGLAEALRPSSQPNLKGRRDLRDHIAKIGAEDGWGGMPSHWHPRPFDEPMLGLVGLWRQGGGPEAHLALAIGEAMWRVGQRRIAWSAFERASRMSESFWPTPRIRAAFFAHCRKRQAYLERRLDESAETLRPAFDAELAHGEAFQRDYQRYEAEKIAAGVPLGPTFHDEFLNGREHIATAPGPEEWVHYTFPDTLHSLARWRTAPVGLLAASLAALLTALVFRWWPRPAPAVTDAPLPPITSAGPDTDGRIQRAP